MCPRVRLHGKFNEGDALLLVPVDHTNGKPGLAMSVSHEIALNFESGRLIGGISNGYRDGHRVSLWIINFTGNQRHHDATPPRQIAASSCPSFSVNLPELPVRSKWKRGSSSCGPAAERVCLLRHVQTVGWRLH